MERIQKLSNWNALRFYKERCIVQLVEEYEKNDKIFQKWIALYDLDKKKSQLNQSKVKSASFDFLYQAEGKYSLIFLTTDRVDLTEENADIIELIPFYFSSLIEVLDYCDSNFIDIEAFQLAWKVEYPMGS